MSTMFTYTKTSTVITDKLESIILPINEAGTVNYVTAIANKLQISKMTLDILEILAVCIVEADVIIETINKLKATNVITNESNNYTIVSIAVLRDDKLETIITNTDKRQIITVDRG